jgi:NADH-quinone oxidoreductase subunit L
MMMGLGVGGVAVGMFHLITHAFFKALLFMGAGSVIHGCHEEQDIHRMGGLRRFMPVTFATYAVGMMALCGFPLLFSGFWSKDAILHSALSWSASRVPFYLGAIGVLLTAFYMTRQMFYVFFGQSRLNQAIGHAESEHPEHTHPHGATAASVPHESPTVMTAPLAILAVSSILLAFIGTPAWPWFKSFLDGEAAKFEWAGFSESGVLSVMLSSTLILCVGLGLGWWFYGRKPIDRADDPDVLDRRFPNIFNVLRNAYFIDRFYEATFIRLNAWCSRFADWLDRWVWNGAVQIVSYLVLGLSWVNRTLDTVIVNGTFDRGCDSVTLSGRTLARLQSGRVQSYLRIVGLAFAALVLFLIWGHG